MIPSCQVEPPYLAHASRALQDPREWETLSGPVRTRVISVRMPWHVLNLEGNRRRIEAKCRILSALPVLKISLEKSSCCLSHTLDCRIDSLIVSRTVSTPCSSTKSNSDRGPSLGGRNAASTIVVRKISIVDTSLELDLSSV